MEDGLQGAHRHLCLAHHPRRVRGLHDHRLDYNGPVNGSNEVAYIQAATDIIRELGLGSVYWPGLRNGDTYSLTTLQGTGTRLSLKVNNQSGLDRLHWAWKQK